MTRVAVLDMAGTTVADDGVVLRAFDVALERALPSANEDDRRRGRRIVRETMGQSKIDVFRLVLDDEDRARAALAAFERAYLDEVADGGVHALPGAVEAMAALRDEGWALCLTTGFPPTIRDALLDRLGWWEVVPLALSPVDAGRGRPHPDLVLTAFLRLGGDDVAQTVVVGDTPSDMASGLRAGAGTRVGVLTGGATSPDLVAAGATQVVGSVRDLPPLVARRPDGSRRS